MAQQRFGEFDTPIYSEDFKKILKYISGGRVFEGMQVYAKDGSNIGLTPGAACTDGGTFVFESEVLSKPFPITSNASTYTVFYSHMNRQITGGVEAILDISTGILPKTSVRGVRLAVISYPGGSVPLNNSMIANDPLEGAKPDLKFPGLGEWLVTQSANLNISTNIQGSEVVTTVSNQTLSTVSFSAVFPFKIGKDKFGSVLARYAVDSSAMVSYSFILPTLAFPVPFPLPVPNGPMTDYRASIPSIVSQQEGQMVLVNVSATIPTLKSIKFGFVGLGLEVS